MSADEVYLSPCCNVCNENQFQGFEKLIDEAIYFFRGVDSFLNPGWGAGSSVRGIICTPGLNRVIIRH